MLALEQKGKEYIDASTGRLGDFVRKNSDSSLKN